MNEVTKPPETSAATSSPTWFPPWDAAAVGYYSGWASILGLALTIVGFLVTLKQVRKVKSAADLARQSVAGAMKQVADRLLLAETMTAAATSRELDVALRDSNYERAWDRCSQLKTAMIRLLEGRHLSDAEREQFRTYVSDMSILSQSLHKKLRDANDKPLADKLLKNVSTIHDAVVAFESRLRNLAMDQTNV